jgi:hypothetical protein
LKPEGLEVEGMGDRISFLDDTGSNARRIEKFRKQQKPKFFNVNDMMGHDANAYPARDQLSEFLVGSLKII